MESVEIPLKVRTRHWLIAPVLEVRQDGDKWWVHFEGSRESMAFQGEKPFEPGDKVKITFEKVEA